MNTLALPPLPHRLASTFDGLARAVAARIAVGCMQAAMVVLVWGRVRRIKHQVLGMLARFQAGTLRVGAAGLRPAMRVDRVGAGTGGAAAARLPRRFAWLLPLVPSEAACFAGQLRCMLGEPEMMALLAASPQARRVLRPLCRMLGLEAEMLGTAGVGLDVGLGAAVPDREAAVGDGLDIGLGRGVVVDPQDARPPALLVAPMGEAWPRPDPWRRWRWDGLPKPA